VVRKRTPRKGIGKKESMHEKERENPSRVKRKASENEEDGSS